jgi:hypothetical protein
MFIAVGCAADLGASAAGHNPGINQARPNQPSWKVARHRARTKNPLTIAVHPEMLIPNDRSSSLPSRPKVFELPAIEYRHQHAVP